MFEVVGGSYGDGVGGGNDESDAEQEKDKAKEEIVKDRKLRRGEREER